MGNRSNLIDMTQLLDIAQLRSLVAIADCGGFQRAASALHLSQGAVSHHIRRLEKTLGRPLFERQGRGSRFTADGDQLLQQARRILALHDETLALFDVGAEPVITVGSTEHAAAQLLPNLASALAATAPGFRLRFRIDRGTRLREGLANGSLDIALLLQAQDDLRSVPVGDLALRWYSSTAWQLPEAGPVPLVAFDNPCALRTRALETLARYGMPAVIGAEATQLAGVQAAVGAGLGVALMATLGQTPERLVERTDLPEPEPLTLYVTARQGLAAGTADLAVDALRALLGERSRPAQPHVVPELSFAQGA